MNKERHPLIDIFLGFFWGMVACVVMSFFLPSRCTNRGESIDTVYEEKWDTVYSEIHDTVPDVREKIVVKYLPNPYVRPDNSNADSASNELQPDSVPMIAVVQKKYSDDSTYTAYVSGMEYEDYPKLDSIIVRQREVLHNIKETITIRKKSHWHFGIQAGYGYGIKYKGFEPYIGIGVTYDFNFLSQ